MLSLSIQALYAGEVTDIVHKMANNRALWRIMSTISVALNGVFSLDLLKDPIY